MEFSSSFTENYTKFPGLYKPTFKSTLWNFLPYLDSFPSCSVWKHNKTHSDLLRN